MTRAYILSVAVVLVAVLGSLLFTETASVKLSVPPQKLVANASLLGSQTGGDLKTQHVEASVTQHLGGPATAVFVAPIYASGSVVFSCSTKECPATLTIPLGTLLTSSKSLSYATVASAAVTRTKPAIAAVRATSSGASWNAAPKTVATITDSSQFPRDLHVTNPNAIAGGADATTAQIIQQSDWDTVRAALETRVTDALDAALKVKAAQMTYLTDGAPTLTVTGDHKVGDKVTAFTLTMTGTTGATAFSTSDAQSLIRAALGAQVPAGQQLTSDPVQITWQILQPVPRGDVTVVGKALGWITPQLSTDTLRARIRGLSPADARKSLQRAVPGSEVEIRLSPVAVPWLPLITQHISMTVLVQPVTQ
jgi:hypothetical protein